MEFCDEYVFYGGDSGFFSYGLETECDGSKKHSHEAENDEGFDEGEGVSFFIKRISLRYMCFQFFFYFLSIITKIFRIRKVIFFSL